MYHYNLTIHTWRRQQNSILTSCMGEPVSRHLKRRCDYVLIISYVPNKGLTCGMLFTGDFE